LGDALASRARRRRRAGRAGLSRTAHCHDRPPMSLQELKRTPFHERISRLSLPQNYRRWAGYITVGSYDLGLDREYWAIRNHAALIDISPLIKYEITGRDAARLLHRLTPRDIQSCRSGRSTTPAGATTRARCSTTAPSRASPSNASA